MHSALIDTRSRTRTHRQAWANETSEEREVDRLEQIAYWLDSAFRVPGIGLRFGFDAILDLIPGVGDAIGALLVDVHLPGGAAVWCFAHHAGAHGDEYRHRLHRRFGAVLGRDLRRLLESEHLERRSIEAAYQVNAARIPESPSRRRRVCGACALSGWCCSWSPRLLCLRWRSPWLPNSSPTSAARAFRSSNLQRAFDESIAIRLAVDDNLGRSRFSRHALQITMIHGRSTSHRRQFPRSHRGAFGEESVR